jgi:hypothetical protein
MDAPSLSAVNPTSVNLVSPAESPPGGAPSAMRGADFANLLGHLMNPGGRQDLAAAGLQALPIGPQIEVITAAEPLPDAASLAAFAKGQGLDEAMVQALFGGALGDGQAVGGGTLTTGTPMTAATLASLSGQGPELLAADQALVGEIPLMASAAMVLSTGLRPLAGLIQSGEAETPPPPGLEGSVRAMTVNRSALLALVM